MGHKQSWSRVKDFGAYRETMDRIRENSMKDEPERGECELCGQEWNEWDNDTCDWCGRKACHDCMRWRHNPNDEQDGVDLCSDCVDKGDS